MEYAGSVTGLTGQWVNLEPVMARHHGFIYALQTDPDDSYRLRLSGRIPPEDEFRPTIWQGVLCQFVVATKRSAAPLGLVVAYNANLTVGYTYLAGIFIPRARQRGLANDAFRVLVGHINRCWGMDRFYLEFPEYNLPQFGHGLGSNLVEEARYRSHRYYAGRYWDYCVYSFRPNFSAPTKDLKEESRS